ncbi:SpoIVB peptidase. Serine peptidase. MEROPS family S55 [Alteribacillus persepolensis]|uniref:SpoIVB peptidase. Serine peptidase. MEROPS family S55 n=1 Tax=Alteribacillus persepolensis TaxID=568899 RepID=A0A1G8D1M8_9BACI|nr:SpoIVB peptidase [Alteribacillus persepolensis]SDH51571.1 SpoIVB peptidase. Serine peptidase. MEROPS family S55 [Alteribacillus persepolensis]
MDWGRKLVGIISIALFTLAIMNPAVQTFLNIPNEIVMFESDWEDNQASQAMKDRLDIKDQNQTKVKMTENQKQSNTTVKVASMPAKQTNIKTLPDIKVVPGGDSIGVKLQSDGVMVVGFHDVKAGDKRASPAREAGMKVGDRIVEMNGNKVTQLEDVVKEIKAAEDADKLSVKVKRGQEEKSMDINLHQSTDGNVMGAYIRNAASGVGTLTFYEPASGKFGALGHVITDSDTKKPIIVDNGTIVRSSVTAIERGANGRPGEKQAVLSTGSDVLGNVTKNSSFGVFGMLDQNKVLKRSFYEEPLPVAFANEVKKGPAQILTVVEGEKVEKFDIEIVQSIPQMHAASKGMVIKVTDEKLLEKTGGIIQGMSGSPIIQDGKLIGAVTHVFVNDATSGYASHIEWMLEEAGIETYADERAS